MAKKEFTIKHQSMPTAQQAYSILLGDKRDNQIVDIPIDLIDEIKDQPHKVHDDKIERIAESMKAVGQIEPVIVVKSKSEGRYTLLAGRHRKAAAVLNGNSTLKAVISSETNEDLRRLILLATNNDRNNDYLPSEKAFAYKEQIELMKKLGYSKTTTSIAEENGTNRKSVHKYLQLTNLDSILLHRVDNGEITVGAGYELSFLPLEKQRKIGLELFNHQEIHINNKLARQIRDNPDDFKNILFAPELISVPSRDTSCLKSPSNSETKKKSIASEIDEHIIGSYLFKFKKDIFKKIVTEFYTPSELGDYIRKSFRYSSAGNKEFWVEGTKNGFHIEIKADKDTLLTYELNYKIIDSICRKYLREHIPSSDIIKLFKQDI